MPRHVTPTSHSRSSECGRPSLPPRRRRPPPPPDRIALNRFTRPRFCLRKHYPMVRCLCNQTTAGGTCRPPGDVPQPEEGKAFSWANLRISEERNGGTYMKGIIAWSCGALAVAGIAALAATPAEAAGKKVCYA